MKNMAEMASYDFLTQRHLLESTVGQTTLPLNDKCIAIITKHLTCHLTHHTPLLEQWCKHFASVM